MGVHQCPKHGRQSGPLCCRHLVDAVSAGSEVPKPLVPFELDLLDDGTEILQVIVCASCVAASRLHPNSVVSGEAWSAEGAYPWVCPTCHICVSAVDPAKT